jgi:hypothetical protein
MTQISRKLRRTASGVIRHWCPACEWMHHIRVVDPNPWEFDGNSDSPTFSPSVKVEYNGPDADTRPDGRRRRPSKVCHYFLRAGEIEFLPDCTHEMAGQKVPLPELPDVDCGGDQPKVTLVP